MRKWLLAALASCLPWYAGSVHAVDGVAVEIGRGDRTDMARVAVQWDWARRWFQGERWHLGGYWDLALGRWHRDAAPGQNDDLVEIGLTPVFRVQRNDRRGPYAEAAIGFHLLSRTSIGEKRFSTAFQFGDHLGIGYRFGTKGEYDVSYRFQHLSNAGIKRPNNGINFSQLRFQYHF
jgi:lipid A 3-O-deacylase